MVGSFTLNDEFVISEFGRRGDGTQYLDGIIDDMYIYSKSVSLSDVNAFYELYDNQYDYFETPSLRYHKVLASYNPDIEIARRIKNYE